VFRAGEEDFFAMMCEKVFLVGIKREWAGWVFWVEPHFAERDDVCNWGDKDFAAVFKAYEAAVEEVIGGWG